MKKANLDKVKQYVEENIHKFHNGRISALESTDFHGLLKKKNPYLFRAKNTITAEALIRSFLDAKLSSSEEEIFGGFMEDLAIFVAKETWNAHKSSTSGVDIEYAHNGKHYLIGVKSGLNWGNSSQWKALVEDFKRAMKVMKQSNQSLPVECVLGCCYGKAKRTTKAGFINQVCGQEFWFMLSGQKSFYTDIVEPLGYKAKELNSSFDEKKAS